MKNTFVNAKNKDKNETFQKTNYITIYEHQKDEKINKIKNQEDEQ